MDIWPLAAKQSRPCLKLTNEFEIHEGFYLGTRGQLLHLWRSNSLQLCESISHRSIESTPNSVDRQSIFFLVSKNGVPADQCYGTMFVSDDGFDFSTVWWEAEVLTLGHIFEMQSVASSKLPWKVDVKKVLGLATKCKAKYPKGTVLKCKSSPSPYYYSSPPPPKKSPPPYYYKSPPPYRYSSPPSPKKSRPPSYYYKAPPPPYYYSSPPAPVNSPPPPYYYKSPPPPSYYYKSPLPPSYYYNSPPPPVKSPPPPYYYNSPPPPVKSPPLP
ncbi:hypothetical protein R1sor_016209 [Riccia sorocarpa]|uniref:Extensin domain-containing protein n=1 Tax=Riccia sorocarpa TaxID=122646 RepID=A0ABD3HIF9_9MARC